MSRPPRIPLSHEKPRARRGRPAPRACPVAGCAHPLLRFVERHVQNHAIHRYRRAGRHRRGRRPPVLQPKWRTSPNRTTLGVDTTIIHDSMSWSGRSIPFQKPPQLERSCLSTRLRNNSSSRLALLRRLVTSMPRADSCWNSALIPHSLATSTSSVSASVWRSG